MLVPLTIHHRQLLLLPPTTSQLLLWTLALLVYLHNWLATRCSGLWFRGWVHRWLAPESSRYIESISGAPPILLYGAGTWVFVRYEWMGGSVELNIDNYNNYVKMNWDFCNGAPPPLLVNNEVMRWPTVNVMEMSRVCKFAAIIDTQHDENDISRWNRIGWPSESTLHHSTPIRWGWQFHLASVL